MRKTATLAVTLAILFSSLWLALGGCTVNKETNRTGELEPVEIREYQGEKLSTADTFRENSIKGPQYIDIETYKLEINGLVQNPRSYMYDEVVNDYKLYKKVVTLDCVEGWSVTILWEGILLRDLLEKAKPLPEAIMNRDILMAFKMNEISIPPERGFPFQLVAESKWGYKWIKWITRIELSDDVNYRGYWESRGYSNTADLDKGFFEQ